MKLEYSIFFFFLHIGYKVCLHVHGVFPYLYVPYDGSAPPDKMGHQIVIALDRAVNILQGQVNSSSHHVFKAVLVSGIPIYGYHGKEHQLFKLYFYNPNTRKHSYDLLLVSYTVIHPFIIFKINHSQLHSSEWSCTKKNSPTL